MPFQHKEKKKGLSLPGMIDIIFLLLVFSLVTLSVSQANVDAKKVGEETIEFDLPRTTSLHTQKVDGWIQTLTFEVDYLETEDPRSPRIVHVLKPSPTDSLTFAEARAIAKEDSQFAVFPVNFLELTDRAFANTDACRLIRESVQAYKTDHFLEASPTNFVEIRAVRETEFRIINYMLGCCSAYGDTIPNISMHTLTRREDDSGI
ncbi:MAG TPA: hypothetical protein ENN17_08175 [bacterium]|nr:hypothetical protein [bacterium]